MSVVVMSEAELQAAVIDLAHLLGYRVHHSRPARMKDGSWRTPIAGDAGFPDLVLARSGTIIFAELKSESGRLTPEQDAWMDALRGDNGVIRAVWRPRYWLNGVIEQTLRGEW